MNINQDLCSKCKEGFLHTKDYLKCLPVLENCKDHNIDLADFQSSEHVCKKCVDFYFYNQTDKICVKGTVPKCLEYDNNKNLCAKCIQPYYIDGQKNC